MIFLFLLFLKSVQTSRIGLPEYAGDKKQTNTQPTIVSDYTVFCKCSVLGGKNKFLSLAMSGRQKGGVNSLSFLTNYRTLRLFALRWQSFRCRIPGASTYRQLHTARWTSMNFLSARTFWKIRKDKPTWTRNQWKLRHVRATLVIY